MRRAPDWRDRLAGVVAAGLCAELFVLIVAGIAALG